MDDFERELKLGFLEEAAQAIADVEQCFLALESNPDDIENVNKIFRLAHNLKGSSKAVGFDEFGHFTHEFETFILRIKNGELSVSASVVSLLLDANDHILKMVEGLKDNLDASFNSTDLLERMINFSDSTETEENTEEEIVEDEKTVNIFAASQEIEDIKSVESTIEENLVHSETNHELIDKQVGNIVSSETVQLTVVQNNSDELEVKTESEIPKIEVIEKTIAEVKEAVVAMNSTLNESNVTPIKKTPPPAEPKAPASAGGGGHSSVQADEYLRVALSKVETLINFVGEMVILQSVLKEQISDSMNPLIRKTVHQLGKVGKEIQDLSMGLRMVPIKPTFQKMVRIVRDTALALNKDVAIQLIGEETEIDKTVLEKINDPLVHLIRNSVDHGIENADLRKQRGKSEKGAVSLKAYHQAGKLMIEVIDDGGGLDAQKLISKATEKGILKPGSQLSEKEAYQLIFAPGFSTKEKVTDVSGRGVGMDVVRTNITDLGGEIRIDSVLGQGTTFTIVLPLTLAIIESMVVTYEQQRFVLPLSQVYETLNPKENMIQDTIDLGQLLLLRGENIPLIRLGDLFDIKSSTPLTSMIAMVIRVGKEPYALVVDDILGQFQVVTKPLGDELTDAKGVSGTTILGDGKPALILECNDLLKRKYKKNYVPAKNLTKEKVA